MFVVKDYSIPQNGLVPYYSIDRLVLTTVPSVPDAKELLSLFIGRWKLDRQRQSAMTMTQLGEHRD